MDSKLYKEIVIEARHRMFKWAVGQDHDDELYPRDQDELSYWVAEVAHEVGVFNGKAKQ